VWQIHIVGTGKKDSSKADVIDKFSIESKNVLWKDLFWPMHREKDGLVNVGRMGVADDGQEEVISVVGGGSSFSGLRVRWEGTRAFEYTADIILPPVVVGWSFCGGKVTAEVESIGAAIVFGQ